MARLTWAPLSALAEGVEATFETIMDDARHRLSEGASNRKAPFHSPVVASLDGEGGVAQRVMILRAFDAEKWQLRFHTDARSPKVGQFVSSDAASVLFYDKHAKIQIRVAGRAIVERDSPEAEAAWNVSTTFARRCYMAEAGPSSTSQSPTSGLPASIEGVNPSEADVAPARANFAILRIVITTLDWLHLANDGHRRALLTFDEESREPVGQWLVP